MSYFDIRDALVAASKKQGGGFVSIADIQKEIPSESLASIAADAGAMHDHGEATAVGTGAERIVRFDQVLHKRPSDTDSALARAQIRARLDQS